MLFQRRGRSAADAEKLLSQFAAAVGEDDLTVYGSGRTGAEVGLVIRIVCAADLKARQAAFGNTGTVQQVSDGPGAGEAERSGKVAVSVPGGTLRVTIDRDGDQVSAVWLTGPTNLVCEGEVRDEELAL